MNQKKRNNRLKWTLGAAVIGAAIVAMVSVQLGNNAVYFYTPDEAIAKAPELTGKTIRVGGMVVPGSVAWNATELDLKFQMSDLKGHDISVQHRGAPPDMFKEGQGVVVEGAIMPVSADAGAAPLKMSSRKLMVKHSEEYKKPGDHGPSMDKAMLEKSIFKEQGGQP
jgi:cytochrome c-type biogenesis protein CcmE